MMTTSTPTSRQAHRPRALTEVERLFADAGIEAVEVDRCPVAGCERCSPAVWVAVAA